MEFVTSSYEARPHRWPGRHLTRRRFLLQATALGRLRRLICQPREIRSQRSATTSAAMAITAVATCPMISRRTWRWRVVTAVVSCAS